MGLRDEILDSNDEDSDDELISPSKLGALGNNRNNPAAPERTEEGVVAHDALDSAVEHGESRNRIQQEQATFEPSSSSNRQFSSEVTDPDFWRGYNKRLAAVQTPGGESSGSAQALTGVGQGEGADTANQSKQKRQATAGKKDHSSPPTSLTDPRNNMKDRRRKTEKAATDTPSVGVIDLTLSQVTTPAGGGADPWAVPSSPAALALAASPKPGGTAAGSSQPGVKKMAKHEKRKRAGEYTDAGSSAADLAPSDMTPGAPDGASPMPPPKRAKRATQTSLATVDQTQPFSSDKLETVYASEDRPTSSGGQPARKSTETASSNGMIRDSNAGHATGSSIALDPGPRAPTSLYIAPSTLTDSQKLQYCPVSLSPDDESLRQTSSAMPATLVQTVLLEPAAGSSAPTIAYPTPSRFAASPKAPNSDGVALESTPAVKRSRKPTGPSSPDIITAPPTSAAGRKRAVTVEESELPLLEVASPSRPVGDLPKGSPRSTRSDGIIDQQPEALRPGASGDLSGAPEVPKPTMDVVGETATGECIEPLPKKKRGRKKKEDSAPDSGLASLQSVAESTAAEGTAVTEEPAKKKRGRPRKSDPPKTASPAEEPSTTSMLEGRAVDFDVHPPNQGDDLEAEKDAKAAVARPGKRPGKRGRKRKQPEPDTTAEKERDQEAAAETTALGEISNNSQHGAPERRSKSPGSKARHANKGSLGGDSSADAQENNNDDNDLLAMAGRLPTEAAKKTGREASPATPGPATAATVSRPGSAAGGGPGKVRYRVGLSRKSHITPLLKSLKK